LWNREELECSGSYSFIYEVARIIRDVLRIPSIDYTHRRPL